MGKIVIFDRNDTLLSIILSKACLWLGWRVISLKAPSCRGVELFEASQLSNMKTSNMYNLKGEFLEHYLETQVDQNLSALQRGHLVAVTQFLMGKLNFCDFIFELQRQLDLKDKSYVTFIHKNLISKEFFEFFGHANKCIFLPMLPTQLFTLYVRQIIQIFVRLPYYLFSSYLSARQYDAVKKRAWNGTVLFFPHKGLNYGDGFSKSYYYDIVESDPDHVMHVEYGVFNQEAALNLANKYDSLGLHYHLVSAIPVRDLAYALRHFPRQAGQLSSIFVSKRLRVVSYVIAVYTYAWSRYLKRNFPSAQEALVGYDILFPKYISNALQIIDVKTTGIQERLALTRLKNFGVSVDKYLVWGEQCIDWVKMNKLCRVNEFKIIDPPRCRLFKNKISNNNSVICFANAPEISAEENRLTFLHNWIVVEEFILAVLHLAEKHRDVEFILRFKNLNLLKCHYFNYLCKTIKQSDNVSISEDYSRPGVSYDLLSDALGGIGHHTSIGDEALFAGIPFIFYDGSKISDSLYFHNFPEYSELFSFDLAQLEIKFFQYILRKRSVNKINKFQPDYAFYRRRAY